MKNSGDRQCRDIVDHLHMEEIEDSVSLEQLDMEISG